jgi:hypothetical protein
MAERRPFHETIVDFIREASGFSEFSNLASFLIDTKIPKNHDAIIDAWTAKVGKGSCFYIDVISALEEQKCEAEAEAQHAREEEKLIWGELAE